MALTKLTAFSSVLRYNCGCFSRNFNTFGKTCTAGITQNRYLHSSEYIQNTLRAQYGGRHTVTLMAGDGVGPELMAHVKEVFRYSGAPVDFEEVDLDHTTSNTEYDNALMAVRRNGVALKGNVQTDIDQVGFKSRNLELRSELELFANVVWCRSVPGVETRHRDLDIIVIRENMEGEYSQLEHEGVNGIVESLKIITKERSMKIARYAFDFATRHGRKKVTAVHKANIMKLGDGLFLECCRQASEEYPDITFDSMIVDNCSMQMVSRPQQFDVLVLPNLYGNIIANIAAGLVGGPGMVSGLNIGDKYALFETGTRNTGKYVAGKNIANPSAMMLAGADMLNHLGLDYHGNLIRKAVLNVLFDSKFHTPDIGGLATTTDVVTEIIKNIQSDGH